MGDHLLRIGGWVLGGMGVGIAVASVTNPIMPLESASPLVAGSVLVMAGWCGLSLSQLRRPLPD